MRSPSTRIPYRRVVCKIHFGKIEVPGFQVEHVNGFTWKGIPALSSAHAVLCSNPTTSDLLKLFLAKCLSLWSTRVSLWDLNLKRPERAHEWATSKLKKVLLKCVNLYLTMHKNMDGYQRYFGVSPLRTRYVPFKANNLKFANSIAACDGDYIVSCGASHRDFDTLLKAVAPLGIRTVIILSDAGARAHGAKFDSRLMSSHVEHVRRPVQGTEFSKYLAEARIVVVPIVEGTLQPAGISVYLEAMALGKPVIVTRGTSTDGILDESLSLLVEPGDPDALRQAIHRLWHDEELRARLGSSGRQYATALGGDSRLCADVGRHFAALCQESRRKW